VRDAGADLGEYIFREIARLLENPAFVDALPAFFFRTLQASRAWELSLRGCTM
jgi:hypothetical protein